MAGAQVRKRTQYYKTTDEMWKIYIQSEDEAGKVWKENWGWILDEYADLQRKMDEKTRTSEYLQAVTKEKKKDPRHLSKRPDQVNHEYGWISGQEDCRLDKFGCDFFKPLPLPDIYKIPKHGLINK